ncbi:MAG TPA: hypothetical protein VKB96_18265 [Gammaproteobacteria bacterium]|nr:hypothetical protein [Gammaproteobacteria bacterium]
MDSLNYLTTYSTAFGAPEVIFLIAHVALAIAGIYYAFIAKSSNTLRDESLRLLGYGLLALGIVGTFVAVLRLAVGAEFSMPIWITIVTVLDVALIAYALYFALSVYPARQAALAMSNRNRGATRGGARQQPSLQSNGTNGTAYSASRPVATTTRRVSRRDRKRKGR